MVDNYKFANNDILIKLVDDLQFDYPVKQIYEDMGLDKGNLSSYLNKKKPVSIPYIKKIAAHYNKDIQNYKIDTTNYNSHTNNIEVTHLDGFRSSIMEVPLVSQYAYGGYLNGYADDEYLESLPKHPFVLDKEYKGEYLCFEVKGDSMEADSGESIPEGSILLCRNVRQEYWKSKLHINKWDFVIVHNTDGILVKRIIKHDVENHLITIHSLNDFYEDRVLNLRDVKQIFNIVEVQLKRKRR